METYASQANQNTSPVSLQCGHTICKGCLDNICKSTKKCPYCSVKVDPTAKTIFNFTVISLMDEQQKSIKTKDIAVPVIPEIPICSECEGTNPVEITCEDCQLIACKACSDMMHCSVARKKHVRVPWSKEYIDPKGFMCKLHPTYSCDLLCTTCSNSSICMMCYNFGAHKEHSVLPVTDAAVRERKKLLQKAGVLNTEISSASDTIVGIDQRIKIMNVNEQNDIKLVEDSFLELTNTKTCPQWFCCF